MAALTIGSVASLHLLRTKMSIRPPEPTHPLNMPASAVGLQLPLAMLLPTLSRLSAPEVRCDRSTTLEPTEVIDPQSRFITSLVGSPASISLEGTAMTHKSRLLAVALTVPLKAMSLASVLPRPRFKKQQTHRLRASQVMEHILLMKLPRPTLLLHTVHLKASALLPRSRSTRLRAIRNLLALSVAVTLSLHI
jgi:hypothetical protein